MRSLAWIALLLLATPVSAEDLTGQWVTVVRHQAKVVHSDGQFQRYIPIGASFAVESVTDELLEIPPTGVMPDRAFVDTHDVLPSSKAAAFMKDRAETENTVHAWLNYAVYLRRSNSSEHFRCLARASELDPLNVRLQIEAARSLEAVRQDDKARGFYETAETLQDFSNKKLEQSVQWFAQSHTITYPHPGVHNLAPRSYQAFGQCMLGYSELSNANGDSASAAEKMFLEALGHDLNFIPASCGLARAYERQKRLDDAIDVLSEIIDRRPHDHVHLIDRAKLCEKKGNLDRARHDFDVAVAAAENCPCPSRARADYFARQKDLKSAIEDLENAFKLDSENPRIIDQRVRLEVEFFAYDEALADLELLRRIEPAATHMRPLEGAIREAKGDFAGAKESYREFPVGRWECCRLCMRQKDFVGALEDCEAIIATEERRIENTNWPQGKENIRHRIAKIRGSRGYCLEQLGRDEEALAEYSAWSSSDPKNRVAHASCARLLRSLKRDAEADLETAAAMEIDKVTCTNLVARGLAKEAMGDVEGAMSDYVAADKVHGKCGASLASMAWLRATSPDPAMRDARQALDDALRAMTLKGAPSRNKQVILAAAYAERGDFDKAVRQLQDFIKQRDSHAQRQLLPLMEQYRRHIATRAEPCDAYLPYLID